MKKIILVFIAIVTFVKINIYAQLSATFTKTVNTNCLGEPCSYEGPTILINELMISPSVGDGSIIDDSPNLAVRRGEWIELYNPNLCEPVNISCYYLGNHVSGVSPAGANGFRLPDNLIVPPGGFVLIRGINATPVPPELLIQNGGNTIEIVVPAFVWEDGVCSWGNRVWFPNVGGWFAFYDANGIPQDAVSWANQGGIDLEPCVAPSTQCSSVASLPSYNAIPEDRKAQATNVNASNHIGQSIRRIPDGGSWSGWGPPTQGACNSLPCAVVGQSTCTGTATINVTGGQPPYTYLWNDSQLQMTQTAVGLCAQTYQVIVTDANGLQDTFFVDIENFVPTVTLNVAAEYCDYESPVNLENYSPVPNANQEGTLVGLGVDNFVFTPGTAGPGTHNLVYTFTDENGCTNSAQDVITVHPTPEVSMNITGEYCEDQPSFLLNNVSPPTFGPTGTGVISGAGVSNTGLNTTFFTPSLAGPGTHTITYTFTSIHGCVNSTTNEITVHPLPVVNVNAATSLCAYDPEIDITLTATPPVQGPTGSGVFSGPGVTSDGNSYFFNPAAAGPGNQTITYTFTTIHGCVGSDTDQITVHNIPLIDLTANPVEAFVPADITFNNNSTWANNFNWSFGDGNTLQSNSNQIVYTYTQAGNYTIILIGEGNGCINSDSVQITLYDPIVYDIPNVFSPNGDDINPFFNLINVAGFEKVQNFEFLILNRWGNVIRKFEDKYFSWDGKGENGADVPEGVYFYKLYMTSEFGDVFENHGFFHLIR
jgi:gliding motility-associated-like protein